MALYLVPADAVFVCMCNKQLPQVTVFHFLFAAGFPAVALPVSHPVLGKCPAKIGAIGK